MSNAKIKIDDICIFHTVASLRKSAGGPSRSVTALCAALGQLGVPVDLFSQDVPAATPDDGNVIPSAMSFAQP